MIRLEGQITARAPITVSYPSHSGLPRSPHGEIVLHGGTFRGPLRSAVFHALRAMLAEHNGCGEAEVFSLRDVYMLAQGVDITREVNNEAKGKIDPVSERRLRDVNPMLSMFGRWMLPGRLAVSEMRTDEANAMTAAEGAGTEFFKRHPDEVTYLSEQDQQALLSQIADAKESQGEIEERKAEAKRLNAQAGKSKRNGDEQAAKALFDEASALKAEIDAVKDKREGPSESIIRPIPGAEAIDTGSVLSHRMTVLDGDHIGLLLHGLANMARQPFLGGHRNTGCGEFSAEWHVRRWKPGAHQPDTAGRVAIGPDGFEAEGEVAQAMSRFADRIGDYRFDVHTLAQARELS